MCAVRRGQGAVRHDFYWNAAQWWCACACDRDDADDYQDGGNVNNHGGVPVPMLVLGWSKCRECR